MNEELNKEEVQVEEQPATAPESGEKQPEEVESTQEEPKENPVEGDSKDPYYEKELKKEQNRKGYSDRKKVSDIDERVEKLVEEKTAKIREEMLAERERDLISSVATSEEEAEKINFYLGRIKRSTSLSDDVQMAKFLANRSKYENLEKELEPIKRSSQTGIRSSAETYGGNKEQGSQFSDAERALFAKYGLDGNGKPIK